jgi:purine/pyrimidine-nucleoside phosphorylase
VRNLLEVTVQARANLYFEGRVVSHTLLTKEGEHKTVGVILPGSYHFGTAKAERMEIVEGGCDVLLDQSEKPSLHVSGDFFEVPANSGFTITVKGDPCHYICSFLD